MKFFNLKTRSIFFYIFLILPSVSFSQMIISGGTTSNTNGTNSSAIPTAVPFLLITPDSRSGAMGEAGVALSPDADATYWNPAKLAFSEG